MKRYWIVPAALLISTVACSGSQPTKHAHALVKPDVRLTLVEQNMLTPGKPVTVLAKLNNIKERVVITPEQLEVTHTQKFHLLLVDQTLTDYQHVHPEPTTTPGIYKFTFTPKLAGGYRAWADITLIPTGKETEGKHEFAMADLESYHPVAISKTERHEATVGSYHFTLSFDKPPVEDGESMGTLEVKDASGHPVSRLEPVMGAYAHFVGFYDDFRTIAHIHPIGDEPKKDSDRGGPELTFHFAPEKPGFVKLFAQIKIGGKELFVPFGVNVAKAQ